MSNSAAVTTIEIKSQVCSCDRYPAARMFLTLKTLASVHSQTFPSWNSRDLDHLLLNSVYACGILFVSVSKRIIYHLV